jgi:replicative DNA helicase
LPPKRGERTGGAASSKPVRSATLPEDLAAEVSVLGAMIIHNGTIDVVIPILKTPAFSSPRHRKIYEAILGLHEEKCAIDLVTLRNRLQRDDALDAVGGMDYLMQVVEAVPAAANAEHYARLVQEKYTARSLIGAAEQITAMAGDGSASGKELLDHSMKLVYDIAEAGMKSQVMDFRDVLKKTFEQIESWRDREGRLTGLETGYYELDDLMSGLQPSELIILAARPSMGKTSLALNIADNVGVKLKKPVAIFSLEMAHEQLARNMLCAHARIDSHRLRRGRLGEAEWGKMAKAMIELSGAPIFIDDTAGLTPMELRAKARRLKSQHEIELVVVDYMQLMEGPRAESRQQEISMISRSLKGLARELGIPIIAVAQLNRGVEDRVDHRPRMSDLRESGAIEQDADVVALLHRQAYYGEQGGEEEGSAELIVAKQRNGPTGTVKLTFLRHCMRFENYGQEH